MEKSDLFYIMHHLKQWEEKDKRIKRTVIVSLILGIFLITFIIFPSVKVSERIIEKKTEIESLKLDKLKIEKLKFPVLHLKKVTEGAKAFVKEEPWNDMKHQLKLELRNLRYSTAASSERMQMMQRCADETLRKIRGKIKKDILEPLGKALENIENAKDTFKNKQAKLEEADSLWDKFNVQMEELREFLHKWESHDIGEDWYRTTPMLETKIWELSAKMNETVNENLFPLVELMLKVQQETQVGYNEKIKNMDVTLEKKQAMLINLKDKMNGIIPGWINEIVSMELIIQLFPIVIIMSLFYMMLNTKLITKHCLYLSRYVDLSEKERRDVSLPSVWSLTWENKFGNMICWLLYFSFFIVMWVYFEMGCYLQIKWLLFGAEIAWVQKIFTAKLVQWLGRLFFILLMLLLLKKLPTKFEFSGNLGEFQELKFLKTSQKTG